MWAVSPCTCLPSVQFHRYLDGEDNIFQCAEIHVTSNASTWLNESRRSRFSFGFQNGQYKHPNKREKTAGNVSGNHLHKPII
jgi:hypothetical protein